MKIINKILLFSFLLLSLTACVETLNAPHVKPIVDGRLTLVILSSSQNNWKVQFTLINKDAVPYNAKVTYVAVDQNDNAFTQGTVYFDAILGVGKSQTKTVDIHRPNPQSNLKTIIILEAKTSDGVYAIKGVEGKTYSWE